MVLLVGHDCVEWLAGHCPNLTTLHLVGHFWLPTPNSGVITAYDRQPMGSLCMLDMEEWVDPISESAIRLLSRAGLEELVLSAAVDEYTLMLASCVDDQEDSWVDFSPSPEAVREFLGSLLVLKRFGWQSRVDPLDTLLAFPRSLPALRSLRLD